MTCGVYLSLPDFSLSSVPGVSVVRSPRVFQDNRPRTTYVPFEDGRKFVVCGVAAIYDTADQGLKLVRYWRRADWAAFGSVPCVLPHA